MHSRLRVVLLGLVLILLVLLPLLGLPQTWLLYLFKFRLDFTGCS